LCSWCVIVFSYGSFDVKIVQEGFEKIVGLNVNVCVCVCVCGFDLGDEQYEEL